MKEESEIDTKEQSPFGKEKIDRKPQVETISNCEVAMKASGDIVSNIDQCSIIKSDCVYIKCEENLDLKCEDRIASEEIKMQKDPLHFRLDDYPICFIKHSNFTALVKKQPTVCLKRLKSSLLNRLDKNIRVDLTSISEELPNPAELEFLNNRISNTDEMCQSNELQLEENLTASHTNIDEMCQSNELQLEENLTATQTNLKSTDTRLPETCPVCKVNIVGLAAHLRTHDIPEDVLKSIYYNMKRRPTRKCNMAEQTCPLDGCEGAKKTLRLDLHLRSHHKLSPKDDLYRKLMNVTTAVCPSFQKNTKPSKGKGGRAFFTQEERQMIKETFSLFIVNLAIPRMKEIRTILKTNKVLYHLYVSKQWQAKTVKGCIISLINQMK